MIEYNGKEPFEIHYLGKEIAYIYMMSKEVWTSILSCFGKGYWINDKPWVDEDAWKNS